MFGTFSRHDGVVEILGRPIGFAVTDSGRFNFIFFI